MNGDEALAFVRERYAFNGGNYQRVRNQQIFLKNQQIFLNAVMDTALPRQP